MEVRFTPTRTDTQQSLHFYVNGRHMPEPWIDEALIRRESEDVTIPMADETFVNGRFYRRLEP